MTVFNLEEKQGVWFEMEDGGRVQLHALSTDEFKAIKKQTTKKKVDFKKVEGTPQRFEYEEVNEDLQNELFWDAVIVAWEKLFDGKGSIIPCTKENKIMLMNRSVKFAKFVSDGLKTISDSEAGQAAQAEKN